MVNIKIVTATDVRNNWFAILEWLNSEKKEILIKKNKKIVARLIPEKPAAFFPEKIIKSTFGLFKKKRRDFPYENSEVKKRERSLNKSLL